MERIVEMTPAFDRRNPDPNKNYGIHGVDMRMVLKGERGAVQFVLFTAWHLPHVQKELFQSLDDTERLPASRRAEILCAPQPADLGYHSRVPQYEGQDCMQQSCEYLDGDPCYYDGSGLNAERIYHVLLEKGSDGVWVELEKYYFKIFGELR